MKIFFRLSKSSFSKQPGGCRDTRVLQPVTESSGLQGFPRGNWTKQLGKFPTSFSSEKIVAHHGEAKKHRVAGYRMCRSEKVSQALINYSAEDFVYARANVQASFSLAKSYIVQVKIRAMSGDVGAAFCCCAAGRSGVCKHVAAFLFFLLDVKLSGQIYIPDTIACTEKKQVWGGGPGKGRVTTNKFRELVFVKHEPGKPCKGNKRLPPSTPQISVDMLETLNSTCIAGNVSPMHQLILQAHEFQPIFSTPPAVQEEFSVSTMPRIQLPNNLLWYDEVQQILPIDYKLLDCDLSLQEAHGLEEATRMQSTSDLWHRERENRITSSKFRFITRRKKEVTPAFLKTIFKRSSTKPTRHMQTGIANEPVALEKYRRQYDGKLDLFKCGFVVNPGVPFLGASPDGVVYDQEKAEFGLVEVKTLAAAMDEGFHIHEAYEEKKAGFLTDKLQLDHGHHYYLQVQGQLALTGLQWCDFLVDCGKEFSVERISFNRNEWVNETLPKLVRFYAAHMCNKENGHV